MRINSAWSSLEGSTRFERSRIQRTLGEQICTSPSIGLFFPLRKTIDTTNSRRRAKGISGALEHPHMVQNNPSFRLTSRP